MAFIEAKNIVKIYAGHAALEDVSIHVPEGTIYGLLGPNGAGKTTLIRIINRITAPDSGEVFLNNRPINEADISHIGYLPEERGLYKKMKVGEQALYLARLKGLSKADALKKLNYWFEKFEIQSWWNKKIETLSKGMAQKVQFIITVLHNPQLLILDEPFSGFDPVNANQLKQEVLKQKSLGKTIILSTHDMSSVEELCDSITLIDKSRIVLEGSVKDVKEKFKENKFEIIFSGKAGDFVENLNGRYHVEELVNEHEQVHRASILLDSQEGLKDLINITNNSVNLHSFREVFPTMSEVFIKAVSKSDNRGTHE